jgi:hypothetical protein
MRKSMTHKSATGSDVQLCNPRVIGGVHAVSREQKALFHFQYSQRSVLVSRMLSASLRRVNQNMHPYVDLPVILKF